jgi:hypothetical protein
VRSHKGHAAKKEHKKKNNIRVVDLDPHSFELLDTDPDPGGQKRPTNIEKS